MTFQGVNHGFLENREIFVGRGFNPAENVAAIHWASAPVWIPQLVVRARLQPCRNCAKIAPASAAEVPLYTFFANREMANEKGRGNAICQHRAFLLE